ncbi:MULTISPECIES: hypothetical protein [unclassified Brenneria]|nr:MULTISPECIES: hypothetical protein [unclassified Brenneria]MDX5630740.1 hypothetical protein [Brenneria sp. L3-3Z]MDX5697846.1 hypothetical protein [Brenneria sp. L4-2C]
MLLSIDAQSTLQPFIAYRPATTWRGAERVRIPAPVKNPACR